MVLGQGLVQQVILLLQSGVLIKGSKHRRLRVVVESVDQERVALEALKPV